MRATLFDDRMVEGYREAEFLVSIYEGVDQPGYPWSEASYLLADSDLARALLWLRENLPADCSCALGNVQRPSPRYEGPVRRGTCARVPIRHSPERTRGLLTSELAFPPTMVGEWS